MFKELQKLVQGLREINLKQELAHLLSRVSASYEKLNLPKDTTLHLQNISILLLSYIVVSAAIYPDLSLWKCAKEIFSLLCMYAAIFIWFMEKITTSNAYKVLIGVTAIFAPVIFVNSSLEVAIVTILFLIILEYVVYEYASGCNLFSNLTPVYIVCSNHKQIKGLKSELNSRFKIIGFVLTDDVGTKRDEAEIDIDRVKFTDLEKKLSKLDRMFFLPYPREILYLPCEDEKRASEQLSRLCLICAKFSLKVFKISCVAEDRRHQGFSIVPVTTQDVVPDANFAQLKQKTTLNAAFKNSRVWVFADESEMFLDLIHSISTVSSVDLTVFCDSIQLSEDLYSELTKKRGITNYKTKIADINMISLQESKPDIIFYSLPVKGHVKSEYSLKEILVKNVLYTQNLIEYAQNARVKYVFIMSSSDAVNASNWIGATQRLGELIAQHADAKSKRLFTKFKVIRTPLYSSTAFKALNNVAVSILSTGSAIFYKDKLPHIQSDDTLFRSLLRLIFTMIKEDDPFRSVYTISSPSLDEQSASDLAVKASSIIGLKNSVKVVFESDEDSEQMDLENFPNIQEEFEETEIPYVTRTKLLPSDGKEHEGLPLTLEIVRNMNTRELISFVFQEISIRKKSSK